MKLSRPKQFSSFYESFSDLIFGTMAIFVLLMIVFLSMVGESDSKEREELKKELTKATSERDSSRQQAQELVQQMAQLESAVKAKGLHLVIAVDTSGSMEKPLIHLIETINTIANVLPKITSDFRIGIVAYRLGENDQQPTQDFQLQKIFTPEKDAGQSSKNLAEFMKSLNADNGLAPVEIAIDRSIEMLSRSGQHDGFQAFMLLGDVGPYEDNWGPSLFFEPSEIENERRITEKLKRWVQGSERRKIISMFSGLEPERSMENYSQRVITYQASERFFRAIVSETGQSDNYTDNPAQMLAFLLNAIIEN